uniref:Leucine rich glioma inactivated 1 n=1 Tax=Eptatretus burgeri TaxID=7764 RepID=A0A8C4NIN7_EPTBU
MRGRTDCTKTNEITVCGSLHVGCHCLRGMRFCRPATISIHYLRGNSFSCNCKNKWLVTWLQVINASIPEVYCAAPLKFSGRSIRSLRPEEFDCFATEFVEFQTLHMHSYSVESYIYRGDVNVVLAQPRLGKCTFLEWDHVEGLFRVFDNITAVISCKPVVIDDQLVVIMAQLVGGSHIYKRDEHSRRFLKIQDIDRDKIRKPSDVETFQIEGEQYAIITDSSKAGVTTLYRWNGNGFYSQQSLHHWYRDTDGELVHILGGAQLVLTSSSQLPVLYEWDREQGLFSQGPHTNIPDVEDAVTVRSFSHAGQLYLCLTRYIGDSKVMKWKKSSFQAVQTMPSRGSMLLQPFHVGLRQYGVLGSDFAFSQVFRWDADIDAFVKLQELNVQAPRAFTVVSVGKEDFLFASSFTSKTVIYRHHVVDTSL